MAKILDPYRPENCDERIVTLEKSLRQGRSVKTRKSILWNSLGASLSLIFCSAVVAFVGTLGAMIFGASFSIFTPIFLGLSTLAVGIDVFFVREELALRRELDILLLASEPVEANGEGAFSLARISKALRELPRSHREEHMMLWQTSVEAARLLGEIPHHEPALKGLQERAVAAEEILRAERQLEAAAENNRYQLRQRDAKASFEALGDSDLIMARVYAEAIREGKKKLDSYTRSDRELA